MKTVIFINEKAVVIIDKEASDVVLTTEEEEETYPLADYLSNTLQSNMDWDNLNQEFNYRFEERQAFFEERVSVLLQNALEYIGELTGEGISHARVQIGLTQEEYEALGYKDTDEEDQFSFLVSVFDEDNNPSDNLDNFVLLEDAIDHAKNNPGSGVFYEKYDKEKEICEYTLLWHPCGDCFEYLNFFDCKRNVKQCSYSEAYQLANDECFGAPLSQEQGKCPVCGSNELDYSSIKIDTGQIAYPWTCKSCQSSGDEWYELQFIEHNNIQKEEELK
jgi:hypothetical protein